MIIRRTPKNKEKYLVVTDMQLGFLLQQNGYSPKYIDEEALYFVRSKDVENFVNISVKAKERDNV